MIQRLFDTTRPAAPPGPVAREDIYPDLRFPRGVEHPERRPYTAINMVATVDGKVVVGGPGTTALIGGPTDHYLMARIDGQADGLLFGANLIRQDNPPYPRVSAKQRTRRVAAGLQPEPLWLVVSRRGEFDGRPRLFEAPREQTALLVSEQIEPARRRELSQWTQVLVCGEDRVDAVQLGHVLRDTLAVHSLVCLGGPLLNATLVEAQAVDELFLTLAPKLQGGSRLPSAVEGLGFQAEHLPVLELVSLYADGSELYLRYRFRREVEA